MFITTINEKTGQRCEREQKKMYMRGFGRMKEKGEMIQFEK